MSGLITGGNGDIILPWEGDWGDGAETIETGEAGLKLRDRSDGSDWTIQFAYQADGQRCYQLRCDANGRIVGVPGTRLLVEFEAI